VPRASASRATNAVCSGMARPPEPRDGRRAHDILCIGKPARLQWSLETSRPAESQLEGAVRDGSHTRSGRRRCRSGESDSGGRKTFPSEGLRPRGLALGHQVLGPGGIDRPDRSGDFAEHDGPGPGRPSPSRAGRGPSLWGLREHRPIGSPARTTGHHHHRGDGSMERAQTLLPPMSGRFFSLSPRRWGLTTALTAPMSCVRSSTPGSRTRRLPPVRPIC